jgi:hypothetical protein
MLLVVGAAHRVPTAVLPLLLLAALTLENLVELEVVGVTAAVVFDMTQVQVDTLVVMVLSVMGQEAQSVLSGLLILQ